MNEARSLPVKSLGLPCTNIAASMIGNDAQPASGGTDNIESTRHQPEFRDSAQHAGVGQGEVRLAEFRRTAHVSLREYVNHNPEMALRAVVRLSVKSPGPGVRAPERRLSAGLGDKGEAVGMLDPLQVQIDIDVRPIEVFGRYLLDVEHLLCCCISKPWKEVVIEKVFVVVVGYPNPVRRELHHLNRRSDDSRHL